MIKSLWCIVLLSLAAAASSAMDSLNGSWLVGVSGAYNERRGYDDINGGANAVNRDDMVTYGITGGKRFALRPWLRLQVEGVIQYGSAVKDTWPAGTNLPVDAVVRQRLLQGGLIADLQLPLEISGERSSDSRFYFHAGMGLHLARIWETEWLLDDQSQEVTGDPALEPPHVMLSPSVHGGLGWETRLSRNLGLAIAYTFRYWDPVHYTATGDEFPLGVPYSERFLSHELDAVILFK